MKIVSSFLIFTIISLIVNAKNTNVNDINQFKTELIIKKKMPPAVIFQFTGNLKNGCRVTITIYDSSETYPNSYPYTIGLRCGDRYGILRGTLHLNNIVELNPSNYEIAHEYDDEVLKEEFISTGGEEEVNDIMINAMDELLAGFKK